MSELNIEKEVFQMFIQHEGVDALGEGPFRDRMIGKLAQCIIYAKEHGLENLQGLFNQGLANRKVAQTLGHFYLEHKDAVRNENLRLKSPNIIQSYINGINNQ